jgi:hypothetical protein
MYPDLESSCHNQFKKLIAFHIVIYPGYVANNLWVLDYMNRFIGESPVVTTNNCNTSKDCRNNNI